MGLVQRIVEEVADREDTCQADLQPLYESLDPEALQELVESAEDITIILEFPYNDYTVRIGANGNIEIKD